MRILQQTDRLTHPEPALPGAAACLSLGRVPPGAEAFAALFPDFVIERGRSGAGAATIAAWSGTPGLARRHARAAAQGTPFVMLGEGVLRAPPRGGATQTCLSALALAISGRDSPADRLNPGRVLAQRAWEFPALIARAASARRSLVSARLGGMWWQERGESDLPKREGYALVALAEPAAADSEAAPQETILGGMLDAALSENPAARVVVLAPGIGRSRYLAAKLAAATAHGATVIRRPLDPWPLIERAGQVYSAGGEIGFLALLAGRPVAAFGRAFYTGWGVTRDAATVPQHAFTRSIDEILAGSCLVATRYRDPFRNAAAAFEDVLDLLAEWREIETANHRIAVCVGMSFWKRRRVADFLRSAAGTPVFRHTAGPAVAAALRGSPEQPRAIAVWASRMPQGLAEAAARHGVPLIRVEDGFVRSVGLGSDFLPPASLVLDAGGMYYDPRTRSDLETLLREAEFAPALIGRARRLIAQLLARGVTKYNLGSRAPILDMPPRLDMPFGVRRIFVPGQVEDDLSVRLGGGEICSNLDLLARVRADNPDAFILYKPHPDVAAGHRIGAVPEALARRFADAVVPDVSTAALLGAIDELHTMTSLAGFEALLRARRVVVYGTPFYAGWGLTTDMVAIARGRRLTLEELAAGVLILYPRYLDPVTRLPCGPEVVIERLDHPELWRPGPLVVARRLQGALARWFGEIRASLSALPPSPERAARERAVLERLRH